MNGNGENDMAGLNEMYKKSKNEFDNTNGKSKKCNDIFISYRNDGEGNNFAARLFETLSSKNYSVYFNSNEQHSGSFPDRLKEAIEKCIDFVLIVSHGCLDGLKTRRETDWVRAEVLYAYKIGKRITPVYIGKADVPNSDVWKDYPNEIRFLFSLQSVYLPERFEISPISDLLSKFVSKPSKEIYRDIANSNKEYDLHKDFIETLKKAEAGDTEAMFEIGCMYYHGFANKNDCNGKTNYSEAAKWFQRAEENNTYLRPYIYALIGNLYYRGQMPYEEQSFKKAMEYYEKAAKHSSHLGYQDRVGFMLSEGFGVEFDYSEIVKIYENIKENCSVIAKYNMAKFYIDYGQFQNAIDILESIETPFADAEYCLGMLYQRGVQCEPPKPDMYRAIEHFRNASEMGHMEALHELGLVYFRGTNGYRQDLIKARIIFKRAAEQGHSAANYDYAWMCTFGLGGHRNIEEAIYYYERAAEKGHVISMVELAQLYQEPECRNYQKAYEWAQKGAATGDPTGEFVLGNLYFFGRGCETDMDKAVICYKKALQHGVYQAKFMMEKVKFQIEQACN